MDGFLLALFLIAVATGFLLGRRSARSHVSDNHVSAHNRYLEGLRHLLNEQPDAAIDALISELDVNQDTVEMYFALGALWRRKGEMDRAIRVHQTLLSNTALTLQQVQQAQLELALDYTHSGLLDRGEVLLRELVDTASPIIQLAAGRELALLYQEEQDWEKALIAVDELCSNTDTQGKSVWRHLQAHYCCELAESVLAAPDWNRPDLSVTVISAAPEAIRTAKQWLQQAESRAPDHPRVLLLRTLLSLGENDVDSAWAALQSIRLEPGLSMVAVPLIFAVTDYERDEIWRSVSDLYQSSEDIGLIPYLTEFLYRKHGSQTALDFLIQELRQQERQESLAYLLDIAIAGSLHYESLRPALHQILPFRFTCRHCGFHGRQFYWSCPSCKTWL